MSFSSEKQPEAVRRVRSPRSQGRLSMSFTAPSQEGVLGLQSQISTQKAGDHGLWLQPREIQHRMSLQSRWYPLRCCLPL